MIYARHMDRRRVWSWVWILGTLLSPACSHPAIRFSDMGNNALLTSEKCVIADLIGEAGCIKEEKFEDICVTSFALGGGRSGPLSEGSC
ncbi:hypothetical protein F5X98DRAFT_358334 [Xylaria grammica]|nr:hypothetical protein F5X98DRAFT_358334 [Xylaria grammica]